MKGPASLILIPYPEIGHVLFFLAPCEENSDGLNDS